MLHLMLVTEFFLKIFACVNILVKIEIFLLQTPSQAAQMAAGGPNTNLTAVSMAMPVNNGGAKLASNGSKNQNMTQGQTQGQQQGQPQGQPQVSGSATMVAGKPTMLPPQSAAPLVLGQIGKISHTHMFLLIILFRVKCIKFSIQKC